MVVKAGKIQRGMMMIIMMMMMMIPGDCSAACCDNRSWHSTHSVDTMSLKWLTRVVSNRDSVTAADAEWWNATIIDDC